MNSQLIYLLFITCYLLILGGITFISHKLGVPKFFTTTFFFHASIYLSVAVWETAVFRSKAGWLPEWVELKWIFRIGLWGLMFGLIGVSFFVLYVIHLKSQKSEKLDAKLEREKTIAYGGLLIGIWMLFGVLEDFLCYIFYGFDEFSQEALAGLVHPTWFLGIPVMYYLAIPGIIFIVLSFWTSRGFTEIPVPSEN